jgi:hypothetical protein
MKTIGNKREVYEGEAVHTSGGLKKGELMKNKRGKIVSKKQHDSAKSNKNLGEYLMIAKDVKKEVVRERKKKY